MIASYRIGDRVEVKNTCSKSGSGKIIYIASSDYFLIEFDNYVNGHDGSPACGKSIGKQGYCWYVSLRDIYIVNTISKDDEYDYEIEEEIQLPKKSTRIGKAVPLSIDSDIILLLI